MTSRLGHQNTTVKKQGTKGSSVLRDPSSGAFKSVAASILTKRPAPNKGHIKNWTYEVVRSGVLSTEVRALENARILAREDVRMIIPDRTLERRISAGEMLKTEEADGIARLLRVVQHARDVFDNDENADEWLHSPNPALAGEVPMKMARTDLGAREVEAILGRIEHGVFG